MLRSHRHPHRSPTRAKKRANQRRWLFAANYRHTECTLTPRFAQEPPPRKTGGWAALLKPPGSDNKPVDGEQAHVAAAAAPNKASRRSPGRNAAKAGRASPPPVAAVEEQQSTQPQQQQPSSQAEANGGTANVAGDAMQQHQGDAQPEVRTLNRSVAQPIAPTSRLPAGRLRQAREACMEQGDNIACALFPPSLSRSNNPCSLPRRLRSRCSPTGRRSSTPRILPRRRT